MLFEAKQFEQHFNEKLLKRGLLLFEKSAVELIEKHGASEFRFLVARAELVLRKRAERITSYACTCAKNSYCEHLAAALFFLQQDTLGISPRPTRRIAQRNGSQIKKISHDALFNFISSKGKLSAASSVAKLIERTEENCAFYLYISLCETINRFYTAQNVLNQEHVNSCARTIRATREKIITSKLNYNQEYYFTLALLVKLQELLQLRFSGDESPLIKLRDACCTTLDELFLQGITITERKAWQEAVFMSVRNNKVIRSGGFSFLVPRLLCWLRARPVLRELKTMLARRHYKPVFTTQFDLLSVAVIQVNLREQEVFKISAHSDSLSTAETLAAAGLAFCRQKINKAFQLLLRGYESLLQSEKQYFNDYVAYVIDRARHYRQNATEAWFTGERITKSLYLQPDDLDRYLELTPNDKKQEALQKLADKIKNTEPSFDKLAVIYRKTGETDALIKEIKKQDNAFRLLHEVLIKKLPEYKNDWLTLYARQFINAAGHLKIYSHELQLFETARLYLDRLPGASRNLVIDKIVTHAGSESQLSKHIRNVYKIQPGDLIF